MSRRAAHRMHSSKPLIFERQARQMDYRWFINTGTMVMWLADYRPAGTQQRGEEGGTPRSFLLRHPGGGRDPRGCHS